MIERDTQKLHVLRGLPGSGKSTLAATLLNSFTVRVETDALRRMLYNKQYDAAYEPLVHEVAEGAVKVALFNEFDVVVDECCLDEKFMRAWEYLAQEFDRWCGNPVELVVHDLRHIGVEECVRRDAQRPEGKRVGREVIERFASKL